MLVEPHDSGWLCFLGAMGAAAGLSVWRDGWGLVLEGWEVPTHQRAHGAGGSRLGAGPCDLPAPQGGRPGDVLQFTTSLPLSLLGSSAMEGGGVGLPVLTLQQSLKPQE